MSEDLAGAGLRTFFRIAERWRLSDPQQVAILGLESPEQLAPLKTAKPPAISPDTLERISYVFGIFKAINTLLPVPERADGWIRAANAAPLFGGRTPLDRMTSGSVCDLLVVRQYLDSEL